MKNLFKSFLTSIFIILIQTSISKCNINDLSLQPKPILTDNYYNLMSAHYIEHDHLHNIEITAVAITCNGKIAACGTNNGIVNIIRPLCGKRILTWVENTKILALAFSPDDKYLAYSTEDARLHLYQLHPKKLTTIIDLSDDSPAQFVCFGKTNDTIFTCHQNRFIVLWRYENNKYYQDRILSLYNYDPDVHVTAVSLSEDEKSFAVAYNDGSIISYSIHSNHQEIITSSKSIIQESNLSRFLAHNPYHPYGICTFNFLNTMYGEISSIYVTPNLNYAIIGFCNSKMLTIDLRKSHLKYICPTGFIDV